MLFNKETLNKVRTKLITALALEGFTGYYRLSQASEDTTVFIIEMTERDDAEICGQIKKCLGGVFGEQLFVVRKSNFLHVDTRPMYKALAPLPAVVPTVVTLPAKKVVIEEKPTSSDNTFEATEESSAKEVGLPVHLTKRELEIIVLICEQLSSKEIADKLFLSEKTVAAHRTNLMKKLKAKNSAGVVIYAIKNKLFSVKSS